MKNKDVYDNYDDAIEAYGEMCKNYKYCSGCPYGSNEENCYFSWLYAEAKEPDQWQKNILDKFYNKE